MKLSVVDEAAQLRAENAALRDALRNLMETFADACVVGSDGHLHVSYICDGQFGYRCSCRAHDDLTAAKLLLDE